jgi:nucleoid DNA-binding protein
MSTTKYLIQYELEQGQWITIGTSGSFDAACEKAKREGRLMKWAHMTSVIKDGDPECLRRVAEINFALA